MAEKYSMEVIPRLVVTKHEKWHHDGARQHQYRQDPAGRTGDLQPGRGLPAAEVRQIVEEETGEGHKVSGGPRATAVFVDRLDPRRHSRKHCDGDAEDVEDTQSEHPCFPEDRLQWWDGRAPCLC